MKRIMWGIGYGFSAIGIIIVIPQLLYGVNEIDLIISLGPKLGSLLLAIIFLLGFLGGIIEYNRKQRKREEEEERQAEQEETNRLMREYLEKKLREDEKDA